MTDGKSARSDIFGIELTIPRLSKGFTLIETIITLVVLSIAMIGVLSVFTTGIRGSANPLLVDQATQLAQGEMDQVIGEKIANGFATISISATAASCDACVSAIPAGFACCRNICYVDPAVDLNTRQVGPTDYEHITVTVSNSAIGSVKVEGLISNY